MQSKVRIAGHPVHPMLVSFPIASYVGTLASYLAYAALGHDWLFRMGVVLNVAGIASATLAAVPGFLDWALAIPRGSPANRDGAVHMLLNTAALVLFAASAAVVGARWGDPAPSVREGVWLSAVGVAFTMVAGFMGWRLVQTHHVGVKDRVKVVVDRRKGKVPVVIERRRRAGTG